ncbi:MAG: DNA-binding protein [Acidimicrobiales bacterium]|nr:MAG: DNA-binding protein [Acidimicrobiales bacterium]
MHHRPLVSSKPRLRGWIHAGGLPFVLAASMVLVALARPGAARTTTVIYAVCALTLFAISAIYHRGNWTPRIRAKLRRLDHANIYLLIAGTCIPVDALGLTGPARTIGLWIVTVGAAIGIVSRLAWPTAPRALYTATYIIVGWSTLPFLAILFRDAGVTTSLLVIAGGAIYTAGAVVYGLKRPNPWPRWFGFHEIFHACTLAAWTCQYVAILRLAT